eukprot:TRINITY_DN5410_c0_g1_i2.p1 TRINITY_DN5410_c0_g1~~TRINITY_DN5410_c0_g1_i2.p1  ORF type:complete len:422 (+),score=74.21 TRINITY_DN5410_c0_g1_i2:84-1349(+)
MTQKLEAPPPLQNRRIPGMSDAEMSDFLQRKQNTQRPTQSPTTLSVPQPQQQPQVTQSNVPVITLVAGDVQGPTTTPASSAGFSRPLPPSTRIAGRPSGPQVSAAGRNTPAGSTAGSAGRSATTSSRVAPSPAVPNAAVATAAISAAASTALSMASNPSPTIVAHRPSAGFANGGIVRRQTVETLTPSSFLETKLKAMISWLGGVLHRQIEGLARTFYLDRIYAMWQAYCKSVGWKGMAIRGSILFFLGILAGTIIYIVQQRRRIEELALYIHDVNDEKCLLAEEHAIMKRQMEESSSRTSQLNSRELRLKTLVDYRLEKLREFLGPSWDSVYYEIKLEQEELQSYFLSPSEALVLLLFDELERSYVELSQARIRGKLDHSINRLMDLEAASNCPSGDSNTMLSSVHEHDPDGNMRMAKEV